MQAATLRSTGVGGARIAIVAAEGCPCLTLPRLAHIAHGAGAAIAAGAAIGQRGVHASALRSTRVGGAWISVVAAHPTGPGAHAGLALVAAGAGIAITAPC